MKTVVQGNVNTVHLSIEGGRMSEQERTERTEHEGEREVDREVGIERPDGTTIDVDTEKETEREGEHAEHEHREKEGSNG